MNGGAETPEHIKGDISMKWFADWMQQHLGLTPFLSTLVLVIIFLVVLYFALVLYQRWYNRKKK